MKKQFLLLILIFLTGIESFSITKIRFTHYTADDGLSQNRVMDIIQDQKGYMWFATWDGLNKFDGRHFSVYKGEAGDPNGFTNNRLNSLVEDHHGYLWIITNDFEVYRFNPIDEKIRKLSYSPNKNDVVINQPVRQIEIIDDDNICIFTLTGCYIANISKEGPINNLKYYSQENGLLAGDDVRAVMKDKEQNLWFLTEKGISFYKKDATSPQHYFHQNQNETAFSSFLETPTLIYFGADNGQLWSFNKKSSAFNLESVKSASSISGICALKDGEILLTTLGDGIYFLDNKGRIKSHITVGTDKSLASNNIISFYKDMAGDVWLEAEAPGVVYLDVLTKKLHYFIPKSDELIGLAQTQPNFFVIEDNINRLWVHPRSGGFSEFDRLSKTLKPFFGDKSETGLSLFNTMHDAYYDNHGNLWLSTRSPGLEKCTFHQTSFIFNEVKSLLQKSGGSEVRTIFEDNHKRIWIADKEGKIELTDLNGKSIGFLGMNGKVKSGKSVTDMIAYDIMADKKGRIWLACKGAGIILLEETSANGMSYKITRFNQLQDIDSRPSSASFYALLEDKEGRIWAGSYGSGLNLILENEGKFSFIDYGRGLDGYPYEKCRNIRDLNQDENGIIWIATVNGIVAFDSKFRDPSKIKFFEYRKEGLDAMSLRTNDVHFIHIDKKGNRWFGTFGGGLNMLKPDFKLGQKPEFEAVTQKQGLPSDIILSINEDLQGYLWLTSENSITRYDKKSGNIDIYNKDYGLDPVTFSESSSFLDSDGNIWSGTMNGYYKYNPANVKTATFTPSLVFTRFFLFDREIHSGVKDSPFLTNIDEIGKIVLKHDQNVFSIEFAALDFKAPENIQYSYRLDPVDKDWIKTQKVNRVTYTKLSPGEYTFRVKSTNSEGFWMNNERSIEIVIKPSFWQTSWAIMLYCIAGIAIFVIALYFFTTIYKLKSEVVVEQKVTDMKLRFFTDMSHELRTPLTLISAPVEHVIQDTKLSAESRSNLIIVQKNIDRMLRLINQLLDFRKYQEKKMRLRVEETPFGSFTSKIAANFEPTAGERDIKFIVKDDTEGATVYIDREKYDTIVYNLLSNAFKFTSGGKTVTLLTKVTELEAILTITDEGKGISKDKLQHLFDRFYSDDETNKIPGTGIGLSLVKDIVDLHKGRIEVESETGSGSTFEIRFKLGHKHFEEDPNVILIDEPTEIVFQKASVAEKGNKEHVNNENQPLLLVVEDNVELRNFLTSVLSKKYRVADAADGLSAWHLIGNLLPDFVITDLMMPVMDGLELTRKIKSDEKTCHIPVIILTAKSDLEAKVEGMHAGVDDYITKPFSAAYLEARVDNIFTQRNTLQEKYRQDIFGTKTNNFKLPENIQSQDSVFLNKIIDFMEDNISNSELTVEMLVSAAGMGRTVFFNKLKGILGLSPIEFIKETRIKRAAQLLETGKFNVSEVSFQIGMNDARYFSKCFKQKYGVTPSEYKTKTLQE
jgi:signal transduction histidine kinase/ligand-binding sensor domain-containing protein/CheY-like chemotaxis protein/AraC-like DNA-binding protein